MVAEKKLFWEIQKETETGEACIEIPRVVGKTQNIGFPIFSAKKIREKIQLGKARRKCELFDQQARP